MRAKILVGIIAILLMMFSISVYGIDFPLPVNGIIHSNNVAYQDVKVTNLRTGISETGKTNSVGEYFIEWANTPDNGGTITRHIKGDQFKIEVLGCVSISDKCTQIITHTGKPEIFVIWDLNSLTLKCGSCPKIGSCGGGGSGGAGVIYRCTQEEAEKMVDRSAPDLDCNNIDDICTEEFNRLCELTCDPSDEGEPCEKTIIEEDCPIPENTPEWILGILIALGAGGASYFYGVKSTKNVINPKSRPGTKYRIGWKRDGTPIEEHMHFGLRGYHSIHTSHSVDYEKHPKGEKLPYYKKDDYGTYKYVGGK